MFMIFISGVEIGRNFTFAVLVLVSLVLVVVSFVGGCLLGGRVVRDVKNSNPKQ